MLLVLVHQSRRILGRRSFPLFIEAEKKELSVERVEVEFILLSVLRVRPRKPADTHILSDDFPNQPKSIN